jgi:hypothetical protein
MKHARTDYNRIQDPAGLIPEDEPVFLLRGQDALAPKIVEAYAMTALREGVDDRFVNLCWDQAEAMVAWQSKNNVKMPDLDPQAANTPLSRRDLGRVNSADPVDINKILEAFAKFVYGVNDVRSFNDVNVFDQFFADLNSAERSHLLRVIQTAKI